MPEMIVAMRGNWRQRPAALTKRRAVDFCRVATALCPPFPGGSQPAAPPRGRGR
ncbi:MAG TPA: putative leader peptide [Streptosporangiaceae bacterium]|jgi:hypothetical protein